MLDRLCDRAIWTNQELEVQPHLAMASSDTIPIASILRIVGDAAVFVLFDKVLDLCDHLFRDLMAHKHHWFY